MKIAPEFLEVVRSALAGAKITDADRVEAVAAKLAANGWAWVADPAGSTSFIPSESGNISAAALAEVTTTAKREPNAPAAPVAVKVFGHTAEEWSSLSAVNRQRFIEAGTTQARARGEGDDLLAARRALGEGVATAAQITAIDRADKANRAAATQPTSRQAITQSKRAADERLAGDLVAANGAAIQGASSDPQIQKLAAAGGVHAVRNARRDIETARRTAADKTASANVKAYAETLRVRAEKVHQSLRDIPLGDPGYLAPTSLGIERNSKFDVVGVVAHYSDRQRPQVQKLLASEGALDLDVHADPLEFLQAMATCEVVISSSLHGLVFAEALGIPNLWFIPGRHVGGDGFKFRDWFGTTRKPQSSPQEVGDVETLRSLASLARLHDSQIDCAALAAAFPAKHKADARETQ